MHAFTKRLSKAFLYLLVSMSAVFPSKSDARSIGKMPVEQVERAAENYELELFKIWAYELWGQILHNQIIKDGIIDFFPHFRDSYEQILSRVSFEISDKEDVRYVAAYIPRDNKVVIYMHSFIRKYGFDDVDKIKTNLMFSILHEICHVLYIHNKNVDINFYVLLQQGMADYFAVDILRKLNKNNKVELKYPDAFLVFWIKEVLGEKTLKLLYRGDIDQVRGDFAAFFASSDFQEGDEYWRFWDLFRYIFGDPRTDKEHPGKFFNEEKHMVQALYNLLKIMVEKGIVVEDGKVKTGAKPYKVHAYIESLILAYSSFSGSDMIFYHRDGIILMYWISNKRKFGYILIGFNQKDPVYINPGAGREYYEGLGLPTSAYDFIYK